MKLVKFIWLFIAIVCLGCASKKAQVPEATTEELDQLITEKSFEIISDWAQPLATNVILQFSNVGLLPAGSNAGNINLIGNPNYLQINDTVVKAFLPFYGERRMGGSLSNIRSAIQFEDTPKEFKIDKAKKDSYKISFRVADKYIPNENYLVQIQVFPNLSSILNVNSSHRTYIQYRGKIKAIEPDNEKK